MITRKISKYELRNISGGLNEVIDRVNNHLFVNALLHPRVVQIATKDNKHRGIQGTEYIVLIEQDNVN